MSGLFTAQIGSKIGLLFKHLQKEKRSGHGLEDEKGKWKEEEEEKESERKEKEDETRKE